MDLIYLFTFKFQLEIDFDFVYPEFKTLHSEPNKWSKIAPAIISCAKNKRKLSPKLDSLCEKGRLNSKKFELF